MIVFANIPFGQESNRQRCNKEKIDKKKIIIHKTHEKWFTINFVSLN